MSAGHFAPEIVGPSFDTLGGEVQQPGTIRPGAPEGHMQLQQDKHKPPGRIDPQSSDKFGIRNVLLGQLRAYQLLPFSVHRKRARIQAIGLGAASLGCLIGSQAAVDNALQQLGATAVSIGNVQNVWYIPSTQLTFVAVLEYTSKEPLWVCAATTADIGQVTVVQAFDERYETGTPVT